VKRQCEILHLSRASVYHMPVPISLTEVALMRLIVEIRTAYPFYGSHKIRDDLWAKDHRIGCSQVRRLTRKMGIEVLL